MLLKLFDIAGRLIAPFRTPTRRQSAALCWRRDEAGDVEVLLVTTRRTKRWTPPKGNPMKKRDMPGVAAREAWEEAGVRGEVRKTPLGAYRIQKNRDLGVFEPLTVDVYPILVETLDDQYPEADQRARRWFSKEAAADTVRERDLARLISRFSP